MRHCITLSYGIVIGLAPASGVAGDKEPFMAVLTFSASTALGMKCIRSRNNIASELTMFSILPNTSHFLKSCALVGFHSFHLLFKMKFSAFFVIASAAFAVAAPGVATFSQERAALNESAPSRDREDGRADLREPGREEGREGEREDDREDRAGRGRQDGRLNRGGLAFSQVDLNYLLRVNQLNLGKLQVLSQRNNFNIVVFQDLFASRDFSLQSLLQLQQLSTMLAIAETGIFDQFELSRLDLGNLNLGLINGIAGLNLAQFIDAALKPQITIISKEVNNNIIIAK
ncbi:hypothetical protein Forpe1208_v007154 [Fusarium oxysporum f. sp. rapae]|uniref:Uncharacterized protein n=1 Tax=Fusarium oxysporum f. sp. rapae TaxID=485398 RepID=A0A8J5P8K1_FUSOX|nr:hypothetical protein Forpe1208_v007154 [Fusarium oxysporum f. sp. rapae]